MDNRAKPLTTRPSLLSLPALADCLADRAAPEFAEFAGAVLDDALDTYSAALSANDGSVEMANRVGLERRAILRAGLDRDLSPEDRKRVLDDIRDVHEWAIEKDTENKRGSSISRSRS